MNKHLTLKEALAKQLEDKEFKKYYEQEWRLLLGGDTMVTNAIPIGKWIQFVLVEQKPKTNIWHVTTKDDEQVVLGIIKWHSPWRKYTFYPCADTLYENICLKDIARFIEWQMEERKI